MASLRIEGLHVTVGDFSLHIDDVTIQEGELFGILGHSGAGKSTLLKTVAGLETQFTGKLWMDGQRLDMLKPHERGIAYVFQDPVLFEHLLVGENLKYLLHVKKIPKQTWDEKVTYALECANALHLKERMPNSLSGGEKQRVAIATALLFEPRLLIMDEPFSALDPDLRTHMRRFFKALVREHKITTLFVTHDKEEAFVLFDRMALLDSGAILQVGTPKELYEHPLSMRTVKYFGIEGALQGKIENKRFIAPSLSFTCNKDDTPHCRALIPPHAITLNQGTHQGNILSQEYIEGRWKVYLENALVAYSPVKIEKSVCFEIDASKVHFLEVSSC